MFNVQNSEYFCWVWKNIYDHVLDYNFLEKYQQLYPLLLQIFVQKKTVFVAFCTKNMKIRGETREMELLGASQHQQVSNTTKNYSLKNSKGKSSDHLLPIL